MANFSAPTVCSGDTLYLTDTSIPGTGIINTWNWSNNIYNTPNTNPSYIILDSCGAIGNQTLTITDDNNCTDNVTMNIYQNCNPIASFIASEVCQGDGNVLSSNSSDGSGTINTWNWNINGSGNVLVGNLQSSNLIYEFDTCGSYSTSLTVVDNFGCENTFTDDVITHCNSIANFTLSEYESCGPASIQATADQYIYNDYYYWETVPFDPNVTFTTDGVTNDNPIINFPENTTQSAITYTIRLITENQTSINGLVCQDTAEAQVIIWPTPLADFLPLQIDSCSPLTINFNNLSNPYNGESISSMNFDWIIQQDTVSNLQDPSFTFINNGVADSIYTVELFSTSIHGVCR